jgi:hypothetical protein
MPETLKEAVLPNQIYQTKSPLRKPELLKLLAVQDLSVANARLQLKIMGIE